MIDRMYRFKIETKVDSQWNDNLVKNTAGNFFQSSDYLNSDSKNFFPVFIHVFDESENLVGQLGLTIIKSTVLYSGSLLHSLLQSFSKLTTRGIWLYGPIIHSNNQNERLAILEQIIAAINVVCQKFDLVFMEGYTSPYDDLVNEEYVKLFTKNYAVSEHVTFMSDLTLSSEQLWQNVSKKARGDVNRAKRRNIIVKELHTLNDLKEFLLLHKTWAKTKGLEIDDPFQDLEKLWHNHESGVEKFFLAYQDDKLISGLRISCFNGIAYTHFVVSAYSESTSLGGTLLTWSAIEWSKNAGMRLYDFSGGPKSNLQNKNTLLFYKKKWGGNEYVHYNVIKVEKKLYYAIYRTLFSLVRFYHNFKSRKALNEMNNESKDETN